MCKLNKKNDSRRIDPCLKELIINLNVTGIRTVACCCGHGKYPISIIVEGGYDMYSSKYLKNKKKFYKKDRQGYYYLSEVIQ